MSSSPPSPAAPPQPSRGIEWPVLWAGGAIVAAVLAAYANSVSAPFVFDDQLSIVENPTIRQFSLAALVPPSGQGLTVEGRPLLNLSLALNYAISGLNPWSYHLLNVAIHVLAALTLFGLVRRTLAALNPQHSTLVSFSAALLWAVHPLQTESVTYLVQRTESLMGLFYLLTLYCFARGATAENKSPWFTLAVVGCAFGMATKEVMVSAPLIVLLYDRTFVAGSFREAWRRRSRVHLALAATWLLLAWLVIDAGNRGGTIGASAGVTGWQYALCQSRAVVHYLRLALWPEPLVFDYGSDFVTFSEIAPYALLDMALLAATGWALWRRPALGFLGACFFVILAPTTSVVGGTRQMLAEHRMYLSLAALAVLAAVGLHAWLGRRSWLVWTTLAMVLIAVTARRNMDYSSELALYADTVAKRPDNVHERYNYAKALAEAGRPEDAVVQGLAAVRLRPGLVSAQCNLANALSAAGRLSEAVPHYEAALRLKPDYAKAHYNFGLALLRLDRKAEAIEHFRAAVRADPSDLDAANNLGGALLDLGRLAEATHQFQHVLRLNPNQIEPHCNLGAIALLEGKPAEAVAEYERALRIDPNFAPARAGLARARSAHP